MAVLNQAGEGLPQFTGFCELVFLDHRHGITRSGEDTGGADELRPCQSITADRRDVRSGQGGRWRVVVGTLRSAPRSAGARTGFVLRGRAEGLRRHPEAHAQELLSELARVQRTLGHDSGETVAEQAGGSSEGPELGEAAEAVLDRRRFSRGIRSNVV